MSDLSLHNKVLLLTPREFQVFNLLAEGLSHKEMYDRLGIKSGTVNAHTEAIKLKLGFTSSWKLRAYAAQWLQIMKDHGKDVTPKQLSDKSITTLEPS